MAYLQVLKRAPVSVCLFLCRASSSFWPTVCI